MAKRTKHEGKGRATLFLRAMNDRKTGIRELCLVCHGSFFTDKRGRKVFLPVKNNLYMIANVCPHCGHLSVIDTDLFSGLPE